MKKLSSINKKRRKEIKDAFQGVDRKILIAWYGTKKNRSYVDQLVNGFINVSAQRAKELSDLLNRPELKTVLRPDIFDKVA